MLSIFRTNQLPTSILLLFYILLLWVSVLFVPFSWAVESNGWLTEGVQAWLGTGTWVSRIIAILLLLINGAIINYMVAEHRIANEVNLFSGLFYILVSCSIPDFLHLSPILMANTFLLFSLLNLFNTYKKKSCADLIFNVGFWIGIASLFYFNYIFFLIVGLIGLGILKGFNLKERLIVLIGGALPYLFVGTYYFWFDQFGIFWEAQVINNFTFLDFRFIPTASNYTILVSFILLVLFLLFNYNKYQYRKNIQVQKKINILYWILIVAVLTTLFQTNANFSHFQIIAIPAGIFLASTFTNMKSSWAESYHFLLLLLVLALQYKDLLI